MLRIEGPTRIVARALSGHTLAELALLHLPRAHKASRWDEARSNCLMLISIAAAQLP